MKKLILCLTIFSLLGLTACGRNDDKKVERIHSNSDIIESSVSKESSGSNLDVNTESSVESNVDEEELYTGDEGEYIAPAVLYEDDNILLKTNGFGEWEDSWSTSDGLTLSVENKSGDILNLYLYGAVVNGMTRDRGLGWSATEIESGATLNTGIAYDLYPYRNCIIKDIDLYFAYYVGDENPVYFQCNKIVTDVSESKEFDLTDYTVLHETDIYKMYVKKNVSSSENDEDVCSIFVENKTDKVLDLYVSENNGSYSSYDGISTRVWAGANRKSSSLEDGQLFLPGHNFSGEFPINITCYIYENWWDDSESDEVTESIVYKF